MDLGHPSSTSFAQRTRRTRQARKEGRIAPRLGAAQSRALPGEAIGQAMSGADSPPSGSPSIAGAGGSGRASQVGPPATEGSQRASPPCDRIPRSSRGAPVRRAERGRPAHRNRLPIGWPPRLQRAARVISQGAKRPFSAISKPPAPSRETASSPCWLEWVWRPGVRPPLRRPSAVAQSGRSGARWLPSVASGATLSVAVCLARNLGNRTRNPACGGGWAVREGVHNA